MNWFLQSNRWKHFLGGIIIGLFSQDWYCTIYSGLGIASALEFKDKQHGGKWDWIDWTITLIGDIIGYLIRLLITNLII